MIHSGLEVWELMPSSYGLIVNKDRKSIIATSVIDSEYPGACALCGSASSMRSIAEADYDLAVT